MSRNAFITSRSGEAILAHTLSPERHTMTFRARIMTVARQARLSCIWWHTKRTIKARQAFFTIDPSGESLAIDANTTTTNFTFGVDAQATLFNFRIVATLGGVPIALTLLTTILIVDRPWTVGPLIEEWTTFFAVISACVVKTITNWILKN